jgi:hypothetical protein
MTPPGYSKSLHIAIYHQDDKGVKSIVGFISGTPLSLQVNIINRYTTKQCK